MGIKGESLFLGGVEERLKGWRLYWRERNGRGREGKETGEGKAEGGKDRYGAVK